MGIRQSGLKFVEIDSLEHMSSEEVGIIIKTIKKLEIKKYQINNQVASDEQTLYRCSILNDRQVKISVDLQTNLQRNSMLVTMAVIGKPRLEIIGPPYQKPIIMITLGPCSSGSLIS